MRATDPILLTRARVMRREMTDAERRLWAMLRNRQLGGWKFRRQVPIGRYIADFVCMEARVVVECDGGQHAGSAYDTERDAWLREQGYQVVRFWNGDVLREPDGVAEMILAALPPPPPP